VEGGQPIAVINEDGEMAKYIRPTQLEKTTVIRHFAMKCLTSARVENLLIRKEN